MSKAQARRTNQIAAASVAVVVLILAAVMWWATTLPQGNGNQWSCMVGADGQPYAVSTTHVVVKVDSCDAVATVNAGK